MGGAVLLYPGIPRYGWCPVCGDVTYAHINMYLWDDTDGAVFAGAFEGCTECEVVIE